MSTNTSDSVVSFLDQTQLEGKAKGEVKVNLDQALQDMSKIIPDEVLKAYGEKKDEDWDPIRFATYCHDCDRMVPPGIGKGYRGKMRAVCGVCNSKKITTGREEALRRFYSLEEAPSPASEKK